MPLKTLEMWKRPSDDQGGFMRNQNLCTTFAPQWIVQKSSLRVKGTFERLLAYGQIHFHPSWAAHTGKERPWGSYLHLTHTHTQRPSEALSNYWTGLPWWMALEGAELCGSDIYFLIFSSAKRSKSLRPLSIFTSKSKQHVPCSQTYAVNPQTQHSHVPSHVLMRPYTPLPIRSMH